MLEKQFLRGVQVLDTRRTSNFGMMFKIMFRIFSKFRDSIRSITSSEESSELKILKQGVFAQVDLRTKTAMVLFTITNAFVASRRLVAEQQLDVFIGIKRSLVIEFT